MRLCAFHDAHPWPRMKSQGIHNFDSGFVLGHDLLPVEVPVFDLEVRQNRSQSFAQFLNDSDTPVFSSRAADTHAKVSFALGTVQRDQKTQQICRFFQKFQHLRVAKDKIRNLGAEAGQGAKVRNIVGIRKAADVEISVEVHRSTVLESK